MTIISSVRDQLKTAMREKNQAALDTFRGVVSACTNELVAQGKTPQDEITDELAQKVILKIIKQRNDSITQFEAAGRTDLVDAEKNQLKYLEQFMPEQMSEEKIMEIAKRKQTELGITNKTKIGMLTGAIMKEVGTAADGTVVKKVVESLFT